MHHTVNCYTKEQSEKVEIGSNPLTFDEIGRISLLPLFEKVALRNQENRPLLLLPQ